MRHAGWLALTLGLAAAACAGEPAKGAGETADAGGGAHDAAVDTATTADTVTAADAAGTGNSDTGHIDSGPATPFSGAISGVVLGPDGPVAGATVRFGGRQTFATSAADGSFALKTESPVPLDQIALTAGKHGWYSVGVAVTDPAAPQTLTLESIPFADDPGYAFEDADALDAAPHCRHCHANLVVPWQGSAHRGAAKNPKLLDMVNGTASGVTTAAGCLARGGTWQAGADGQGGAVDKCYLPEGGLLADLNPGCGGAGQPPCDSAKATPKSFGICGSCHAPVAPAAAAGNVDLNHLAPLARDEGVTCDLCHKVEQVLEGPAPGMKGGLQLRRPPDNAFGPPHLINFGPHSDVTSGNMGNVYAPQFATGGWCSGCHQWRAKPMQPGEAALLDTARWPGGLPLQDTVAEWQASPAKAAGRQCQHCHMPAIEAETATLPLDGLLPWTTGTLGWPRPFGHVRDHGFRARPPVADPGPVGPGQPSWQSLREPLAVALQTQVTGTELLVQVAITNQGAGHSVPTGTPSRALVLLVRATAGGEALAAVGGPTLPALAGAHLNGTLGSGGAILAGATLSLPAGEVWPASAVGRVVRFVAPTGAWFDYPAVGWFATAPAKGKGLAVWSPAGSALVTAVSGAQATLAWQSQGSPKAGARFFLGDPWPGGLSAVEDSAPVAAWAGASGVLFTKEMQAADGARGVPFFRAVAIASDNRIPAGATTTSTHRFALPAGAKVQVEALVLYRKSPHGWATRRGWQAVDRVRARVQAAP